FEQQAQPPYFTGDGRYDVPVQCGAASLEAADSSGQPVTPIQLFHLLSVNGKLSADDVRTRLGLRIAQEIRQLMQAGFELRNGKEHRALRWRDIYCLTATTSEGLKLGEILRHARIPISFYKQEGLFQTEEAAHVRELLAAIADPHDRQRRVRAWMTPFFRLSLV